MNIPPHEASGHRTSATSDVPPSGETLPSPPKASLPYTDLRPTRLTIVAVSLAVAAAAMTVPFFVQSFSFSGLPGDDYPGWRQNLWLWSFLFGSVALVLTLVSEVRERKRRSRLGIRSAVFGLVLSVVGACMWAWAFLVLASAGL